MNPIHDRFIEDHLALLTDNEIARALQGSDLDLGARMSMHTEEALLRPWGERWRELATDHLVRTMEDTLRDTGAHFVIVPPETPDAGFGRGRWLQVMPMGEGGFAVRVREGENGPLELLDEESVLERYRGELEAVRQGG